MIPKHRVIRKDAYVGVKMPKADKAMLEAAALLESRDTSDLAWVLTREGLKRLAEKYPELKAMAG